LERDQEAAYIQSARSAEVPNLEQILDQARRLSPSEQRRLVEALGAELRQAPPNGALDQALSDWLAMAGRFHAESVDVSADKYAHLADAYADKR
jgi:hypothetical protein